jgi:excisionase family DNA binding protein
MAAAGLRPIFPAKGAAMRHRKTVLTTGEVAKICKVAPRTVSKWFDSGQLRGYRIPGSKDRRIPLEQLVRFMRAHGIPLDGLDTGQKRLLILDADRDWREAMCSALNSDGGFEVATADSAFEAGVIARHFRPHVLLVDVTMPDVTPKVMGHVVRSVAELQEVRLIGTSRGLSDAQGQSLLQNGFDAFLSKPFDVRSLITLLDGSRVEELAAH